MNWTEEQFADHMARMGVTTSAPFAKCFDCPHPAKCQSGCPHEIKRPPAPKKVKPETLSGPLDVTLVLWGHCPSKKNLWERRGPGKMILPPEVKSQIGILTTQALFQWKLGGPVDHPDIEMRFYLRDARRDRDGVLVTVMDCLQEAGVLVNDNAAHANGRLILEPCVFVEESEERVEIRLVKKGKTND